MVATMKTCNKCAKTKPVSEFYKQKNSPDGHAYMCTDCERIKGSNYRQTHSSTPRVNKWRSQNREHYNQQVRIHRDRDPEKSRIRRRRWGAANLDHLREYNRRRELHKRGVTVEKTLTLRQLWQRDKGICGVCGTGVDQTIKYPNSLAPSMDHRIPISKGGAHSNLNIQLTHLVCNLSKGAK